MLLANLDFYCLIINGIDIGRRLIMLSYHQHHQWLICVRYVSVQDGNKHFRLMIYHHLLVTKVSTYYEIFPFKVRRNTMRFFSAIVGSGDLWLYVRITGYLLIGFGDWWTWSKELVSLLCFIMWTGKLNWNNGEKSIRMTFRTFVKRPNKFTISPNTNTRNTIKEKVNFIDSCAHSCLSLSPFPVRMNFFRFKSERTYI